MTSTRGDQVVPLGFEPRLSGPKPDMMDRYTTGLQPVGGGFGYCDCRLPASKPTQYAIIQPRQGGFDEYIQVKVIFFTIE